jgi:fructuronate reductase
VNGLRRTSPAAPVRLVHLGLGNFFRAHQAWYTHRAPDADEWGIAAFTGRGTSSVAEAMAAQEGLYTVVTRAADSDLFDVIGSVTRVHLGTDHETRLRYFASPDVAAVTMTVTEAGYVRNPGGGLDTDDPNVQADAEALRTDLGAPTITAPARILGGLAARRAADGGPISVISCDNLPNNGEAVRRVVTELAGLVGPTLLGWLDDSVSFVTTMVDRITPRTTQDDVEAVVKATGVTDRAPVVTEPFSEWVLSGSFPAARPQWEHAGATFTDDIEPFEQRKLWLLNGGHSLLAYAASIPGAATVADAVSDPTARGWLQEWWALASPYVPLPASDVGAYRDALLERFANPRMQHRLAQIAADGSQKLPVRILPTLRAERAAGRMPTAATRVLAAWVCHLRGLGVPVTDARADEVVPLAQGPLPEAVRNVLNWIDPEVGADAEVVAAVTTQAEELAKR